LDPPFEDASPCRRKRGASEPQEARDLDREGAVPDAREAVHRGVAAVAVDEEEVAAGEYSHRKRTFELKVWLLELYCSRLDSTLRADGRR
jgi:hypothetical protein